MFDIISNYKKAVNERIVLSYRRRTALFLAFVLVMILGLSGTALAFTCTAAAGGGNWSAAGTWTNCNSTVPQSGDDVVLDASGGSVVVDSAPNNLDSLTMTGYTGTLSGAGSITVAPASGSTAAIFAGTITWTGTLNLNPANGATVTLSSNGNTLNNITINGGATGTTIFAQGLTIATADTLTLTQGILHTDGASDNSSLSHSWGLFSSTNANTRTLDLGQSAITITGGSATVWNAHIQTNLTLNAGTSTITLNGTASTFDQGGNGGSAWTYYNLIFQGGGASQITCPTLGYILHNLTITGSAVKTDKITFPTTGTITGTLTLNGNSAINRLLVKSANVGTASTITLSGAGSSISASNVDFEDITMASAGGGPSIPVNLSVITGLSGDAGGNTGITFTTTSTQTWSGTAGGNWSTNAWTTHVPLPQDTVNLSSAFSGSPTITADMPRLGGSISWASSSNAVTWSFGSIGTSLFGSLTMASNVTFSGANGLTFGGRGAYTLTSAGTTFTQGVSLIAPSGTLTLQDSPIFNGGLSVSNGTFNANNYAVTTTTLNSNVNTVRTITMGNNTWTLTGTGTVWNFLVITNLTFTSTGSTIAITNATAAAKTFTGGGLTYNNITFSGNNITVSDADTFANFAVNTAGLSIGLILTSSTTTTITGTFSTNGSSGNLAKLSASTAGTAATLSKASGSVSVDYMSIKDSTAQGGATWNAGYHSLLVSNDTGWIFPGRYWVGGTNTWDGVTTSNWATCSGCASGASVPTASTDVFFDANSGSGTITLSASSVAQSLNCTGFTGTVSHPAATTLTLGGSALGNGSVALLLVAGMTYTLGDPATSAISFVSTVTGNTITTGGKTLGNVTFNGSGGSWVLQDTFNETGSSATMTLTTGTLNTNNQSVNLTYFSSTNSNTRTLTLGNTTITMSTGAGNIWWNTGVTTNMTFNANTSTINLNSSVGAITFAGGGLIFNNVNFNGTSTAANSTFTVNGTNTFANLTYSTGAEKTESLILNANQTVTVTFTANGNSITNRALVKSNTIGTPYSITAAAISITNADFQDITGAGAATWNLSAITGGSGDCGGNSGITFTTPATQTWSGTTTGFWSTNAWTSRVPLPQDDVNISSAFSASQTIEMDMPRAGHNINFTGTTGNPTLTLQAGVSIYGSMTLASGMVTSGSGFTLTLSGRASNSFSTMPGGGWTWTSAGTTWGKGFSVQAFGATYVLQDAFNGTSLIGLTVANGTFNANNFSVTSGTVGSNSGFTRAITMGSGTWTLSGTGNVWNVSSASFTLTPNTSTINITDSTATAKTFVGGGLTYNNITFTGDNITVTGANTFVNFAVNNAGLTNGLFLPSSTTTTITGTFSTNGSSGSLAKLGASTAGTAATITKASGGTIAVDYMYIKDSTAAGAGTTWNAGDHSNNVSGNTGWVFPGRWWVGGTGTWNATVGTNWATCSGSAGCVGGQTVPTNANDVFFDSYSGTGSAVITLSASSVALSMNCTGFTGTISHPAATTLTLGGSSLGYNNVALLLVSGMTYTLGNSASSAINFVSTVIGNTITTGGQVLGNITFNGSGGSWILQDTFNETGPTSALTLTTGTLNTNNQALNITTFSSSNANTRTLTLGSSTITMSTESGLTATWWNTATITNMTFNANTSTITLQPSANATTFAGGGLTFNTVNFTQTGSTASLAFTISGANTFNNLNLIGTNGTTTFTISNTNTFTNLNYSGAGGVLSLSAGQTVNATLTLSGTNSNLGRTLVESSTFGTPVTINAAAISTQYTDFQDIAAAGAANWNLTTQTINSSGDCGGNQTGSAITFTTAATQYWHTTATGSYYWSNVNNWASSSGGTGGTGRVPLPQDNANFDANSIGAASIQVYGDMPRLGATMNWTGVTNAPFFYFASTAGSTSTMYGSIIMPSGVSTGYTGNLSLNIVLAGRGSYIYNSILAPNYEGLVINMINGTLTLQGNMAQTGGLTINYGTFNANGYNVTVAFVSSSNTNVRSIQMGSGTWTLDQNYASTVWNTTTSTNLTFSAGTSTINISGATSGNRIFAGGGLTYNNIIFSGDNITVTGSNTFNSFAVSNAGQPTGLFLASGSTQTIAANSFSDNGSSPTNLSIIHATTGGSQATLSMPSGTFNGDYMDLQDSNATGGAAWYAGTHSINVADNTGWLFQAANNMAPTDGLLLGGD